MNTFTRLTAVLLISLALVAPPAEARFGGGGRSSGSRSFGGSFGGGSSHSFGGGFFGGGSRRSTPAPTYTPPAPAPSYTPPAPSYSPPVSSGGSFGGRSPATAPASGSFGSSRSQPTSTLGGSGNAATPGPMPAGGGSFGSRSTATAGAAAVGAQSFGGGMHTGSTTTSNKSGINTGPSKPSTFTTNRTPPPPPAYNGTPQSFQRIGGRGYPVYNTSPWANHSFFWLAPHPWYYGWNPFMPPFYFHPPYYNGYGYVPGGFNWFNLVMLVVVVGLLVWLGIRLFRNREA
ncbi:MAG TPA: hypothetical protein VGK19_14340 [Capsulimonadaceae bacterium]|jgi:hypothetical protein